MRNCGILGHEEMNQWYVNTTGVLAYIILSIAFTDAFICTFWGCLK